MSYASEGYVAHGDGVCLYVIVYEFSLDRIWRKSKIKVLVADDSFGLLLGKAR